MLSAFCMGGGGCAWKQCTFVETTVSRAVQTLVGSCSGVLVVVLALSEQLV